MGIRKHAKVIADIINAKGFTRIAEVGVWRGRFMSGVLWSCPQIKEYWGIDSWQVLNNPEYHERNMLLLDSEGWEELYLSVCKLLLQYKNLKLIRAQSMLAAQLFPKGYFDLVFIDADHTYEYVLQDIQAWTPLVRKGGVITGHDCIKRTLGVVKAVEESFGVDWHRLKATCWMKEI